MIESLFMKGVSSCDYFILKGGEKWKKEDGKYAQQSCAYVYKINHVYR